MAAGNCDTNTVDISYAMAFVLSTKGTSPCVISLINCMSGWWSITWKCSTVCTDFSDSF